MLSMLVDVAAEYAARNAFTKGNLAHSERAGNTLCRC